MKNKISYYIFWSKIYNLINLLIFKRKNYLQNFDKFYKKILINNFDK